MKNYATVDSVVKEFLFESGETTLHKYSRYLSYALSFMREWHFDSAKEVKTAILAMDDIKQADLPGDYVDYIKVGIRCGDIIKTLSINPQMALSNKEDDCGDPVAFDGCDCGVNNLPLNYDTYGGYYFNNLKSNDYGESLGAVFGYGAGYNSNGFFQIYKDKGKIQFSSDVDNTDIYLEYISNGFDPCAETLINPYAIEALKSYMDWKRLWHKGDVRRAEAQQIYKDQLHLSRMRLMDLNVQDIIRISRRSFHQSIKN